MRLVFALLMGLGSLGPAAAADFDLLPAWSAEVFDSVRTFPRSATLEPDYPDGTHEFGPMPHLHISGTIVEGDAHVLKSVLDRHRNDMGFAEVLVSFDSPGGSFFEAIAMSDLLLEARARTLVWDGHRCLSACAIAFMGGIYEFRNYIDPYRFLHVGGTLGFHAPYLSEEGLTRLVERLLISGQPTPGQLSTAFARVLETQEAAFVALVDQIREVRLGAGFLARVIAHGADSHFEIATLRDALDIDVVLIEPREPVVGAVTETEGQRACFVAAQARQVLPNGARLAGFERRDDGRAVLTFLAAYGAANDAFGCRLISVDGRVRLTLWRCALHSPGCAQPSDAAVIYRTLVTRGMISHPL